MTTYFVPFIRSCSSFRPALFVRTSALITAFPPALTAQATVLSLCTSRPMYFMGGWTSAACFVATVSAGLISGLLSRYWKRRLSYLKLGFLGLLAEGMHLFLYFPLLTLGHQLSEILDVLRHITVPMMVTCLVGLMIFYYVLERWGLGDVDREPRAQGRANNGAGDRALKG